MCVKDKRDYQTQTNHMIKQMESLSNILLLTEPYFKESQMYKRNETLRTETEFYHPESHLSIGIPEKL